MSMRGVKGMPVIRSVRGGSVKWNEEDRLAIATLLIKAGYEVRIDHLPIQGDAKNRKEYVVVYEEKKCETT